MATGERESPKFLEVAVGSDFSIGAAACTCLSERSTGLAISSNEELSSSESLSSFSSVNLEARSLMEEVCSLIDGGGPRREDGGAAGSGAGSDAGSGAFFLGEGAGGDCARTLDL